MEDRQETNEKVRALQICSTCHVMFLDPDEEIAISGFTLQFCPGCGDDCGAFDEVPGHYELSMFWQSIQQIFPRAERVALKMTADKGMN